MVLPLTYRCNARCAMCTLGRNHDEDISKDVLVELTADKNLISEISVVNITGGEPFLISDLPDICGQLAASMPSLEFFGFSTNGLLTKQILESITRLAKILKGTKVAIGIELSLDGPPEIHDRVRGVPGAFDKVLKTYRQLKTLDIGLEYLSFGCNLNRLTVNHLQQVLEIADFESAYINFTPAVKSALYFQNQNADDVVFLSDLEKETAVTFFKSLRESRRIDDFYLDFVTQFIRTGRRSAGCIFKNHGMFIDPVGNVYVCSNFEKLFLGSLKYDSLKTILDCENTLHIRARTTHHCKQCGSNCMVYQSRDNDEYTIK